MPVLSENMQRICGSKSMCEHVVVYATALCGNVRIAGMKQKAGVAEAGAGIKKLLRESTPGGRKRVAGCTVLRRKCAAQHKAYASIVREYAVAKVCASML